MTNSEFLDFSKKELDALARNLLRSPEQQNPPPNIWDDAKIFQGREEDVATALQRLAEMSGNPSVKTFVFTTRDGSVPADNSLDLVYKRFLAQGWGDHYKNSMDPNLIGCAINLTLRRINCAVGDGIPLTSEQLTLIEQTIAKSAANDPAKGIVEGYALMGQMLEAAERAKTAPQIPANPIAPAQSQAPRENVPGAQTAQRPPETVPVPPVTTDVLSVVLPAAAVVAGASGAVLGYNKLLRPRLDTLKRNGGETEIKFRESVREFIEIEEQFSNIDVHNLIELLEENFPESTKDITRLNELMQTVVTLQDKNVAGQPTLKLWTSTEKMNSVVNARKAFLAKFATFKSVDLPWAKELAAKAQEAIEQAPAKAENANVILADATALYTEFQTNNPSFPAVNELVSAYQEELKQYEEVLRQRLQVWKMSEHLTELVKRLAAFRHIITKFRDAFAEQPRMVQEIDQQFSEVRPALTANLADLVKNVYLAYFDSNKLLLDHSVEPLESFFINFEDQKGVWATYISAIVTDLKAAQESAEHYELLKKDGYRKLGQEETTLLDQINEALSKGELVRAAKLADTFKDLYVRLQHALMEQKQQQEKTTQRLQAVSKRVADAFRALNDRVQPAFETLKASFIADIWQDLNVDVADLSTALQLAFDDPSKPDDMASKIERLNSMTEQQFVLAAEEMEKLEKSVSMVEAEMNRILDRLNKAEYAKENVSKAIERAQQRIETAEDTRDADDSYIDRQVDALITESKSLLSQARQLLESHSYIKALTQATAAFNTATKADRSANEQVNRIKDLQASLDTEKANMAQVRSETERLFANPNTTVVLSRTLDLWLKAKATLLGLRRLESTVTGLEDVQLTNTLKELVGGYQSLRAMLEQAKSAYEDDENSYRRALQQADNQFSAAHLVLNEFDEYVYNTDVGYEAKQKYTRAKNIMPSNQLNYGISREELKHISSDAKNASDLAKEAISQAQNDITSAVRRRRLEAEAQAAEARRIQREIEAAANRQLIVEQARIAAQRRATRQSSGGGNSGGYSGSGGYGGGHAGSGSSFGGGGGTAGKGTGF